MKFWIIKDELKGILSSISRKKSIPKETKEQLQIQIKDFFMLLLQDQGRDISEFDNLRPMDLIKLIPAEAILSTQAQEIYQAIEHYQFRFGYESNIGPC